jgi:uncharacterized phage protein (TIGR01671 family)
MNRTIKFRAWDKVHNKMVTPIALGFLSNEVVTSDSALEIGKHCELMQFTGKYDSKGVAIYEGDIVRCIKFGLDENFNTSREIWEDAIGPIVWENEFSGYFQKSKDAWNGLMSLNYPDEIEVLGNIYEHPELLKSTSNATT